MPENPYFTAFRGVQQRTSYCDGCAKYPASSWGIMPKMRQFKTHFFSFLWCRLVGSIGRVARIFNQRAKMPRTTSERGFLHFQSQNCHSKLKIGVLKRTFLKRPEFICWAVPILILVFFGGAPGFFQKRVFQNRPILSETTENVVPKW